MSTKARSQPKGLYVLFATEMWERFSFYAMRALLVLYMVAAIHNGGLEWDEETALKLYGAYIGLAYVSPLIGGFVADHYLGQRKSIIFGGVLMAIGHFLMAINATWAFLGALSFIALGNGFFKPCITAVLGDCYEENDARRDGGYSIFYMGVNVGGFLSGIISGYLKAHYGFDYGFVAAGIGMLVALFIFVALQDKYLADVDMDARKSKKVSSKPLTKIEKDRLSVLLTLCAFLVVFIMFFEQAGGLMNLFAERWTDRRFFGHEVPTAAFQSLNPLFIIILAPIISWLWNRLGGLGRDPFVANKMGVGFLFSAAAFAVMMWATPDVQSDPNAKCLGWWLVAHYGLQSTAELCILPVILSTASKLAPKQHKSFSMALVLGAVGVGGWLTGYVGVYVNSLGASGLFAVITGVCVALSLGLFLLSPVLRRLSHSQVKEGVASYNPL